MSLRTLVMPVAVLALMAATGQRSPTGAAVPDRALEPGQLVWPLSPFAVTQPYGCTWLVLEPAAPLCPGGHFHTGLDLAAPSGTPVRAAAAGVVRVAESPVGYGLHVVVHHGFGLVTLYGHLAAVTVHSGESVDAGSVVGDVGSSGTSTGPHLHFEVCRDGRAVDPTPWLPAVNEEVPAWSTRSS